MKALHYQNYLLVSVLVLLLGTSVALAQYKIPSIMPGIMEQFSLDGGSASWLMSIFTSVGILLAVPTGVLAKRFGPKNMLMVAVGVLLVGTVLGAFSGSPVLLLLSRAIEGVSLIFVAVCGPLAIQNYVAPDKRGAATGIFALWINLGSVIGGVVTPTLFAIAGFRGVWFIYAGLAALAALLVFLFVRQPRATAKGFVVTALTAQPDESSLQTKQSKGYVALFRPNTLLFMLGFMFFNLVLLAMISFAPTFMQSKGISPTMSGVISTLPMLLAIISSPLFGVLADKTGRIKILTASALVVMGPCAFVMLTTTGPLMWVAAVVMGLVGMGAPAMFMTYVGRVVGNPELITSAMSVLMLFMSLGQFLGTVVTPLLLGADMGNWVFAGMGVMGLGLAGTICVLLTRFE
jgi:MFS family permease